MTNHGECPKCGNRVLHVRVESAIAQVDGQSNQRRVMSFCCIHCNTVLGVQMDPRAKPRPKARKATKPAL